jgi:hypothetical protein
MGRIVLSELTSRIQTVRAALGLCVIWILDLYPLCGPKIDSIHALCHDSLKVLLTDQLKQFAQREHNSGALHQGRARSHGERNGAS